MTMPYHTRTRRRRNHLALATLIGTWLVCLGSGLDSARAATFSWNQGDGTWDSSSLKWAPLLGGPPAGGDDAILGDRVVATDAIVTLGQNVGTLNQLDITGGVDLMTGGFDGDPLIVNVSGTGSRLVIEDGSSFDNSSGATNISASGQLIVEEGGFYEGGEVTLSSGGSLDLTGGLIYIRKNSGAGFVQIQAGTELSGWGTLAFRDNGVIPSPLFVNDGEIRTTRPFPDFGQRLVLSTRRDRFRRDDAADQARRQLRHGHDHAGQYDDARDPRHADGRLLEHDRHGGRFDSRHFPALGNRQRGGHRCRRRAVRSGCASNLCPHRRRNIYRQGWLDRQRQQRHAASRCRLRRRCRFANQPGGLRQAPAGWNRHDQRHRDHRSEQRLHRAHHQRQHNDCRRVGGIRLGRSRRHHRPRHDRSP